MEKILCQCSSADVADLLEKNDEAHTNENLTELLAVAEEMGRKEAHH